MAEEQVRIDLTKGVAIESVPDGGSVAGRVGDEDVLLARVGHDLFAVGAHCTHYHGPLADGLIVGDTVRCPWHHACFSLRTGEALRAPAFDPVACWRVERRGEQVLVGEKISTAAERRAEPANAPTSILIVGGGAAGFAAADMLRREGYRGPITMISADPDPPVDRPNLSKDYLAGSAQDDWIPMRSRESYEEQHIDLMLSSPVAAIDVRERKVMLANGASREFGALLLATGADPVRLPVPGASDPHVHYLRTFADSRKLSAAAATPGRAVVVGASFIGLEVSASLRSRGLAVDVVAPEHLPLEKIMGAEVGRFIQSVHEEHGVVFHLGQTVTSIAGRSVTLSGGQTLEADIVVMGVGVRPATSLAEHAGLAVDRGVLVDEWLETSVPGIYAAGDVVRYPDVRTGERIHVEHWVLAERHGQVAARNILGRRQRFETPPFFWSQHYDVTINYVGHAERWDSTRMSGSLADRECSISYLSGTRVLAVATIGRDKESLEAEASMERESASRRG